MSTPEEDALSWAGDDDRLTTGSPLSAKRDASGASSVKKSRTKATSKASATADQPQALSSAALIGFGIFGGIYLLFSVAWLITALRNPTEIADILGNAMFQFGLWLAVATPAIWFGAVLYLGKDKKVATRLLFLLVGVAILIPWPYVTWAG
jgi:drug/metabolite transporter superfamily protein YnfA